LRMNKSEGKCEAMMFSCTGIAHVVHHLSYDNLGDEPLWELRAVCTSCHDKIHRVEK
jgi:hypothetical protein